MNGLPVEGIGLEARVQRIFLAQGIFAEARLFPSADPAHRMMATDVDVLASAYGAGFHLTRRHAECKGGKVPLLDRVFWMAGIRTLLDADASFLVVRDFDEDAARFAQELGIQFMSIRQVDDLERALKVPLDLWPCRSDFQVMETLRAGWRTQASSEDGRDVLRNLKSIQAFIEIDSWLRFSYGDLNRAFRYLQWLGAVYTSLEPGQQLWCRYLVSSLKVRLAQYLLAVCRDVTSVVPTDLKAYLMRRLTYGDQDPEYIASVIQGTVSWVKRALTAKNIDLPGEVDARRLLEPPPYADEFVDLIRALTEAATESVYIVLATEVQEFDDIGRLEGFPRLVSAAQAGDKVAALVSGFVIRTLGVSKELLSGVGPEMRANAGVVRAQATRPPRARPARGQRTLDNERA